MLLDKVYYTVARLDGDYAYLSREDNPDEEPKCVARALLPAEITGKQSFCYTK